MAKRRTERGFRIYADFKDYDGKDITVVESSLARPHCVWIQNEIVYCGNNGTTNPLGNAHLTKAMARRVIKALEKFIAEWGIEANGNKD